MQFVCDSPDGKTWFRIETEGEAALESDLMSHAVEKHFRRARDHAISNYRPTAERYIEQHIGLEAYLRRIMPIFLTLRNSEGEGLVTAMLPPEGQDDGSFQSIIVGPRNSDPYVHHHEAIATLEGHFGLTLHRSRCFPYKSA